jgi:exosome complex component RRP43
VVRLGDTAVVCGVRGEILSSKDIPNPPNIRLPEDEAMNDENGDDDDNDAEELSSLNILVPNVELATGCSPVHIPGNPPSTLAQSLSQRILSLLHSTNLVRASDLRILYRPPKQEDDEPDEVPPLQVAAYWTLYIDILFISLDGNVFDAAWCAILAALTNTRLPKAWWNADVESILCSDQVKDARNLRLRGFPVPTTFAVFTPGREKGVKEDRTWALVDPDTFEEDVCEEIVTVTIDISSGEVKVKRIEKAGGDVAGRDVLQACVKVATSRWAEWNGIMQD